MRKKNNLEIFFLLLLENNERDTLYLVANLRKENRPI